jgi:hypothetical protein
LHKQIITFQKFSIPISIDIYIKTYQFVCTRQALSEIFPFPFLSQRVFVEKPFPEFLKAFPDLKVIDKTFPDTSKTDPSR